MNTRAVNAASGVILAAQQQGRLAAGIALALDAAELLNSPEHAAEFEHLRQERDGFRDQRNAVFATNEELLARVEASDLARINAENEARVLARANRELRERIAELEAAPTTVYRASHDSIVMGLYTTAAEARAHCVAEERRTWSTTANPVFDWIEDEEDGVAELVTVTEDGETETNTGYIVTPVEVASEYDEEADE